MSGMFFQVFCLFQRIFRLISFPKVVQKHTLGKVELNGHLMASCVRNICAKNYQNQITGFQVTVENVGDVFWDTV